MQRDTTCIVWTWQTASCSALLWSLYHCLHGTAVVCRLHVTIWLCFIRCHTADLATLSDPETAPSSLSHRPNTFLPLTVAKLSTLKNSPIFGPPCILRRRRVLETAIVACVEHFFLFCCQCNSSSLWNASAKNEVSVCYLHPSQLIG